MTPSRGLTQTVRFAKLSVRGTRMEPHPETGRKRRKSKLFYQTHNPFNLNAEGKIKTRAEIYAELRAECLAWEKALDSQLPLED